MLSKECAAFNADVRKGLKDTRAFMMMLDDARALFMKLTDARVEAAIEVKAGVPHAWHAYPYALPEARASARRVGEFIREHIG